MPIDGLRGASPSPFCGGAGPPDDWACAQCAETRATGAKGETRSRLGKSGTRLSPSLYARAVRQPIKSAGAAAEGERAPVARERARIQMDRERLHRLLRLGFEKGASDIHFQVGCLP